MIYLDLNFSKNSPLEEPKTKDILKMTKKEKLSLIYGPWDYYDRVCSELEIIAQERGFDTLKEAAQDNEDLSEIRTSALIKHFHI